LIFGLTIPGRFGIPAAQLAIAGDSTADSVLFKYDQAVVPLNNRLGHFCQFYRVVQAIDAPSSQIGKIEQLFPSHLPVVEEGIDELDWNLRQRNA
jgi:hypothetical protein